MGTAARSVANGAWAGAVGETSLKAPATATGTTQATALLVTTEYFEVGTTALNTGVVLPTSLQAGGLQAGDRFTVVNHGANPLAVYPPVGGKIANGATNASIVVPAGKVGVFFVTTANTLQFAANISA